MAVFLKYFFIVILYSILYKRQACGFCRSLFGFLLLYISVCRFQRKLQVPTPKTLNITMDITHGVIFVVIWILVLLLICYVLAVVDANKEKKKQLKREYKNSPLDVFWRNLK